MLSPFLVPFPPEAPYPIPAPPVSMRVLHPPTHNSPPALIYSTTLGHPSNLHRTKGLSFH